MVIAMAIANYSACVFLAAGCVRRVVFVAGKTIGCREMELRSQNSYFVDDISVGKDAYPCRSATRSKRSVSTISCERSWLPPESK